MSEKPPIPPAEALDLEDALLEEGPKAEALRWLNDASRGAMRAAAAEVADIFRKNDISKKLFQEGELTAEDLADLPPETQALLPYVIEHLKGESLDQIKPQSKE